jgi:hypothetical protein
VLLSAPVLSPAVALADHEDVTTTSVELSYGIDVNEDDTGKAPQSQAGPKYGPNLDGRVVKINYIGTDAGDIKVTNPGAFQNIAKVDPAAGTALKPGMTTTVKGTPSGAFSAFGGKAPANMDVNLVNGSGDVANIAVRDSSGYDSPANVSCSTVVDSNWKCRVDSNAKNQEIVVSVFVNY